MELLSNVQSSSQSENIVNTSKKLPKTTIIHKIFKTNSSFHVK